MRLVAVIGAMAVMAVGLSAQQKAATGDEAAIAKIRNGYQTAALAQDAAAMAKLYAPDGEEMPPNAPAAKGRAAIEAYHKGMLQQFMLHGMTITSDEVKITGDRAFDVGTYKQTIMSQKGGGMIDDHSKYIVLTQKDATGAWWITHAIYNSDVPLPPPAPAKK